MHNESQIQDNQVDTIKGTENAVKGVDTEGCTELNGVIYTCWHRPACVSAEKSPFVGAGGLLALLAQNRQGFTRVSTALTSLCVTCGWAISSGLAWPSVPVAGKLSLAHSTGLRLPLPPQVQDVRACVTIRYLSAEKFRETNSYKSQFLFTDEFSALHGGPGPQ